MKVLYVSKALVVDAYRAKVAGLGRHADVVAVVPERWGSTPVEPLSRDDSVIRFQPSVFHGHNHFHLYRGLTQLFDDVQPDIVHIDEEPYSLVSLQLARICVSRKIPSVFFAWQNIDKKLPPPFNSVRKAVFAQVNGAIAGTPKAATVLRSQGFAKPMCVLPQFGVDTTAFSRNGGRRESMMRVGFGGRLVQEKGVDLLLRAAALLPGVQISIVGDGPERAALQSLATQLGVNERVEFKGHVRSAHMPSWMHTIDVLALPSRATARWSEQFGRILVEAMASGVAVVASRTGEIPHVVGDAGLLFAENDVEGLASALRSLSNASHRTTLADAGRKRALDNFTSERVEDESFSFYQQLLAAT